MKLIDYKKDPCGQASLPYHKLKSFKLPENMEVCHERDYDGKIESEAYFRCIHDLKDVKAVPVPEGFKLELISIKDLKVQKEISDFIKKCYPDERLPVTQIQEMIDSVRFDNNLWLKLSTADGCIVATGISELDLEVAEGMLEWIQVLPDYHGRGFGKVIVCASLNNFKGKVDFVTVSGRVNNETNPDRLYRSCGFTGDDVWYFISK